MHLYAEDVMIRISVTEVAAFRRGPRRHAQGAQMITLPSSAKIAVLRDAKLLVDAMRDPRADDQRRAFLHRIQRSFREWGNLTEAMRMTLGSS
jgi:hypothetical protein